MADSIQKTSEASFYRLLVDISRELATALDLRTVLERVLFLSLKNVQGSSGSIIVVDEHGVPIDSAVIHAGNIREQETHILRTTLEGGLAGWVARNKQAALVKDTSKDERWIQRKYEDTKSNNPKSTVSAPLMVRDRLVGIMTLTHPEPGFFNEDHLALVQAISDQAAFAVLNAHLYDESQRKAEVMTALAESAGSINASLQLEEVLQRILEQMSLALQAEAVSLLLLNKERNELVFRAATGASHEAILGKVVKVGEGIAGWVAQSGEGLIVPDTTEDERFKSEFDSETGYETRSIAAAPIRVKNEIIGVLEALNPEAPFNEDALIMLNGIGNLAGSAISHAQLFEEVEIARRRYLELFEDNVDPVFITLDDGKILEANRQAIEFTGFSEQELHKMNVHHFHQADWSVVGGPDLTELGHSTTLSYDSHLKTKKNKEVPIEVTLRRVNIDGFMRLQWLFRDMTERLELDKLREDLFSMIYHDLRSPLANVVSGLDLLSSMIPLDDDPALKSILDIAMRSTERVQRLASSLLDTARLEAGQRIGTLKETVVQDVLQEAADAVKPMASSKEMTIELKTPQEPIRAMMDNDMIRRVVINLTENATKYAGDGKTITIGAKLEADHVLVTVADNGRGISAEDQEHIFDKFSRARHDGPDAPKGLGLGLAFCKLAVEAHHGKIWVESELDKGTTFSFTLPLTKE